MLQVLSRFPGSYQASVIYPKILQGARLKENHTPEEGKVLRTEDHCNSCLMKLVALKNS